MGSPHIITSNIPRHLDEKNVIIVRYTAEIEGELVDELTETLDEFLQATE